MAEYTEKALKLVQNAVNAKPVGVIDDFNNAMLDRVRDTIVGKRAEFVNNFANSDDTEETDDLEDLGVEDDDEEIEDTPEEDTNEDDSIEDDVEQQPATEDQESEEKTDG
jgi:hypothetical protein